MAVKILPKEDATNGWSRILPSRTPEPALKGDVRADWLVVGAGFAGLAAARRLAEEPARRSCRPAGGARGWRRRLRAQLGLRHRPAAQRRRRVRGTGGRARIHPPEPGGDRLSRSVRDGERDRVRLHPSRQVSRRPHRTWPREDPGALRTHTRFFGRALSLGGRCRAQARARHLLSHVGAPHAGRAAHEPGRAHQGPRRYAARERDAATSTRR